MTEKTQDGSNVHLHNYRFYKYAKYRRLAQARGCGEVFDRRINAGESIVPVLKDLMPDEYEGYKANTTAGSFRSSVNVLLKLGYEPDELISYIQEKK